MKNIFLVLIFIYPQLYALSLDELVVKALDYNPSLESIRHRISASQSDIDISDQFSNPKLSYAQNTLDDAQPMSRSTVSIQQKLPYFGKRESLKNLAVAKQNILNENLQEARVNLVKSIKSQAYTVWELESLYKKITEYEDLTRQNIELFESYTSTTDNQHMGIMSAELTLSELLIQKSILNAQISTGYAKLSYLSSFDVKDLNLELVIKDIPDMKSFQDRLVNNHKLAIRDKELQKSKAIVKTKELNHYPDINVLGAYSYRENFDNFATFGLSVSLPVYGTENYKEQEARKLTLSAQSLKEDTKVLITRDLKAAYLQMKSAYEIYQIVRNEAIPQIEHMFELTSSSISTGGDLFKYIDILVKKLKLEQKSISAVANYNRAEAKISALLGEMK